MLRTALATLPPKLDETYERIMINIAEKDIGYVIRILQWLAFAERPLSIDELAEVVAINAARDPVFDPDEVLEDPLEALDICSSLVTISTAGGYSSTKQVATLAHYTVKEYLVSERIQRSRVAHYSMQAAKSHSMIAIACLKYLDQFHGHENILEKKLERYKLAEYSAEFWMHHACRAVDQATETSKIAFGFLSGNRAVYLNWLRICCLDTLWRTVHFLKGTSYVSDLIDLQVILMLNGRFSQRDIVTAI